MIEENNIEDRKNNEINNIIENNVNLVSKEEELFKDTRAESNIGNTEDLIKERKKKFIKLLNKRNFWVFGFLIMAIILGAYIRSMPMHDHGGNPGLWDITTNTWTLGPDLDPWLFTRYAKTIVEDGSLPKIDMMRNVPLGFDTSRISMFFPNMIVWTYNILNVFLDINVEFAAAIFPVIMFVLTIIVFFLFVREIFIRKSKQSITKANIIALISTFFMIVIPVFLSRTIAGIPEKESAAFFFMFLSLYLFLKAWKFETLKKSIILAISSGISTALMALIWGGYIYVFIPIAITSLIAFILNKIHKKEFIIYSLWFFSSFLVMLFSSQFSLKAMTTSITTGLAFFVFLIFLIHFLLWKTKLSNLKILKKIKLPKNIISLIFAIILIIILILIFFGPSFIIEKVKVINKMLFTPTTGRWNRTVAENRQPYFTEWYGNFGPFIKNIPVLFWLFFAGSVILFKKMLINLKKKDSLILTGLYILFFFGLVFSRYSPSSIFNGENFISKLFFLGSASLLIGYLIYYYVKYNKQKDQGFEKINYNYLFLFSLFVLCLFTSRSAIRFVMVLGTIAPIFVGYLVVESINKFKKTQDETFKIILGVIVILILILSIFTFWNFYKSVKSQAYSFVPSIYTQQWQKAMSWVREETPKDSVFSHWWDYGYWIQSIGNRATVLDGGNAISFWNYYMGRLVLTGDNQKDALEFLYNHDANYLLIDSSDIGKYGAFSSIGSNENYDRLSWISTLHLDERQTKETNNQTDYVYSGGVSFDEDLIITEDGKEILLPKQKAGVGAIILPIKEGEVSGQPYMIAVYQNKQYIVNLRYLYVNEKFVDFHSGIEAGAYVFPRIINQAQGISSNPIGSIMYLSPRLMRGMLTQIYILDDPFNNFPNFKLVHSEQSLIVQELNNQGMNLPEFVYYGGVQGPIKIWEIEYTGEEKIKPKYIDTDPTKYLNWTL